MPTYTYECASEHHTKIYQHMRDPRPESLPCSTCGKPATRVFLVPQTNSFEPFMTTVGDGKKKIVRNSAEAKDIEQQFQVAEVGSEEWRKRGDVGYMRAKRERRQREAMSALGSMKDDYAKAEAEVNSWGKEYAAEVRGREQREYEEFQREVEAGRVND